MSNSDMILYIERKHDRNTKYRNNATRRLKLKYRDRPKFGNASNEYFRKLVIHLLLLAEVEACYR